ncbi:PEPxxWA-CTERM sorting domain-containing protein [Phenylobacterium sp.]|uniref:PEPxxWA-CTERM sorting domain-containing protein n=1 Tax=Phenylobacterium sp. TaxID=1871053 RepID=UPI0025D36282|nr:PEPxxWA-CTERM sorting domain-containing protein [Phenylobacterium sp.]
MRRLGKAIAAFGAALGLATAAGQAKASTWLVTYAAQSGAPALATLTLDVADALNAVGGYDVLGVSGAVDGDTVTHLVANPSQPFASYSADGMFIFDNVVWAAAPHFSNPGLFFAAASGDEYNLFSDNATTYELYRAHAGVGYLDHSVGSVAAALIPPHAPLDPGDIGTAGVPEPATWTMLILGFGAVGVALRRRRPVPA